MRVPVTSGVALPFFVKSRETNSRPSSAASGDDDGDATGCVGGTVTEAPGDGAAEETGTALAEGRAPIAEQADITNASAAKVKANRLLTGLKTGDRSLRFPPACCRAGVLPPRAGSRAG